MQLEITLKGEDLIFETSDELFSPGQVDPGTLAMLSTVDFTPSDRVLDLGCGYGVVGILAARLIGADRVTMVDVDLKAVERASKNAALNQIFNLSIFVSDGLAMVEQDNFTLILSNPPYHEDFSVPKGFIEKGFRKLVVGGKMIMVVKRLLWYKNKLTSIFGGVHVQEINGYYILTAEKRTTASSKKEQPISVKSKHEKRMEAAQKRKKRFRK